MPPPDRPSERDVAKLAIEIVLLRDVVRTLIVWMGASAASPLSIDECKRLLKLLEEYPRG